MRLTGRRALITGSCRNIGRAIAEHLAGQGAAVVIHSADAAAGEATAAEIRASGAEAEFLGADFVSKDAGTGLARVTTAGNRAVDILVLNAALQIRKPWHLIQSADVTDQVAVNLQANLELLQGLVPAMQERRWGRVIIVGSVQEEKPHPNMLIYAALKSALSNIARNLARQIAADGVTVNVVSPGVVATDRNRDALAEPGYRQKVLDAIPAGRFGNAESCAESVAFLASEAAGYITGTTIHIDGGMRFG